MIRVESSSGWYVPLKCSNTMIFSRKFIILMNVLLAGSHIVIRNIYSYVNPYARLFEVLSIMIMSIGDARVGIVPLTHSFRLSGGHMFGRDGVNLMQ